MVSDGYPIKFSANNTKGEYIAMGLKKAGCKVAMLDEFYGTKGVMSAEKGCLIVVLNIYYFLGSAE